jgi:hypothetical protein
MKRLIVNIILFFVAIFLLSTVGVFGLLYTALFTLINYRFKSFITYWGNLLYQINVGIDQIGNVLLGKFLNNFALIRSGEYPFGKADMTISHVLAVNQLNNNVTSLGRWIINVLERLDPGHMKKSL